MPHMTLSIPKQLYEEMRKHPEIKWTEVARKAISEYLSELGATSMSDEVLEILSPETRQKLASVSEAKARRFYSETVKREWKRMRSLTRAS